MDERIAVVARVLEFLDAMGFLYVVDVHGAILPWAGSTIDLRRFVGQDGRMLIGFKQRFAPFVEDGSKTHTIRAIRADGKTPKTGEVLHCYVNPRQKSMRLLGRFPCVRVQDIEINWLAKNTGMTLIIAIDGIDLHPYEAAAMAYNDGFRTRGASDALNEMHDYWHKLHGHEAFPFRGKLIHWKFP
jgi:hypothetical protein